MQTLEQLQQEVDRLREENDRLRTCSSFGIYTRGAIDLSWKDLDWRCLSVAYGDLDDLKTLNTRLGHEAANEKIRAAFAQIRSSELLCGRWQFGDELVFIAPTTEMQSAVTRIQGAFVEQGLSITIAATVCRSAVLSKNVCVAQRHVEHCKQTRRKGAIVFC
jgi:GGDEF domain-containing protein